ncbi:Tartrate-resistant acid phosphatase type 5 [Chytriomyces hyalinus]|nr:Tartrate-resistant acid phosphatase type 5 [Chytriomyces hyalinus]
MLSRTLTIVAAVLSSVNALDLLLAGDWGNQLDITDMQTVAAAMDKTAAARGSSAVISLGDNFYQGGNYSYEGVQSVQDEKFGTLWGNVFNGKTLQKLPWWQILGNHDWYLKNSHLFEMSFQNDKWDLPDLFYTKRIEAAPGVFASFIFIETDLLNYGYKGKKDMAWNFEQLGWTANSKTMEKQLAWLDNALAQANNDPYIIVVGHHVGFVCGSDVTGSVAMQNVTDLVNKWDATAYIHGHHHTLAYYTTNQNKTLQVQVGSTGNIGTACAPTDIKAIGKEVANTYGFGHLHVDATSAVFDFIDEKNDVLFTASMGVRTPVVNVKADTTYLTSAKDGSVHFIPPPYTDLLLLGDWGNQADYSDMQNVASTMDTWAEKFNSSAIVSLGDNFYLGGIYNYDGVKSTKDVKFTDLWSNVYNGPTLKNLPWWMVLGNHDWYLSGSHVHQFEYDHPNWQLPDFFYTKRVRIDEGVFASLIFIETDLLNYGYAGKQNMSVNFALQGWTSGNKTVEKQLAWLDNALEKANKDQYVIVFGHHTGFACAGDVNNAKFMKNVTALVNKWNATAYVNGHHHTLAAYYTNNGQTLQVQSGSGGNVDAACAPLIANTPGQELANTYGFAHLRINKWAAQFDFVTESGSVAFVASQGPRSAAIGVSADKTYLTAPDDVAVHYIRAQTSSSTTSSATTTSTTTSSTTTTFSTTTSSTTSSSTTTVETSVGSSSATSSATSAATSVAASVATSVFATSATTTATSASAATNTVATSTVASLSVATESSSETRATPSTTKTAPSNLYLSSALHQKVSFLLVVLAAFV